MLLAQTRACEMVVAPCWPVDARHIGCPQMTGLDLSALQGIDVHVHVESDGRGHMSLDDELLEASAKYFKATADRAPTVEQIAEYYRSRRLAAVVFRWTPLLRPATRRVQRGDRRPGRRPRRRADPVRLGRPALRRRRGAPRQAADRRARRARLQVPPQPAGLLAGRHAVLPAVRGDRGARRARARSTPARPASGPACPAAAGSSCG